MRVIPKRDRENFKMNPFAYLANRDSGVYVAHVFQLKVVTHAVVIDADRGLIIDSAEDYSIRLSEENLRRCGGDHAENLHIDEVRLIVDQAKSNPNNSK